MAVEHTWPGILIQRNAAFAAPASIRKWPLPAISKKQITTLPQQIAKILVVAPDLAFRRSLAFAIEAEGCEVDVADRLPPANDLHDRYDCLVVDHLSIPRAAIAPSGMPLILLASRVDDARVHGTVQVLEKPLLGHKLIEALRAALGGNTLPTGPLR